MEITVYYAIDCFGRRVVNRKGVGLFERLANLKHTMRLNQYAPFTVYRATLNKPNGVQVVERGAVWSVLGDNTLTLGAKAEEKLYAAGI